MSNNLFFCSTSKNDHLIVYWKENLWYWDNKHVREYLTSAQFRKCLCKLVLINTVQVLLTLGAYYVRILYSHFYLFNCASV